MANLAVSKTPSATTATFQQSLEPLYLEKANDHPVNELPYIDPSKAELANLALSKAPYTTAATYQQSLEPLYLENANAHLVDALPYIDPLSAEFEQTVKSLIEEEMQQILVENNNVLPDYLHSLPPPLTPHMDDEKSVVHQELKRLAAARPFEKLDMSHYTALEAPAGPSSTDMNDWRKAIETAQSLLEHSANSIMNLELMVRFSKELWLQKISESELIKQSLEQSVQKSRAEAELVNKQRKLEQMECGNELRNLAREKAEFSEKFDSYFQAIRWNGSIIVALSELNSEVMHLKDLCEERGILPARYHEETNLLNGESANSD